MGRDVARAVRPGRAVGRLTGGNLSLVQQSIGTPYEIDTRGAILFLEETRDPMSFVDERLVHLRAAGLLRGVRGIVFGHLSLDRSEEDEFEDFLLDLVSDLNVPMLMDFPGRPRDSEPHAAHRHRGRAGRRGDDRLDSVSRGRARGTAGRLIRPAPRRR